jgi:hypothetical protein
LQLTLDQAKYWPAIEEAIRNRAKGRQARLEKIVETVGGRAGDSPMEVLRNRDPVSFLNRRGTAWLNDQPISKSWLTHGNRSMGHSNPNKSGGWLTYDLCSS